MLARAPLFQVRREALEKFFGRKVNPALVAMHAALEAAFEQRGALSKAVGIASV